MGFSCGIVGLPNVGKSTLFNSLSNAKAEAQNFPFCTVEPNVGMNVVGTCGSSVPHAVANAIAATRDVRTTARCAMLQKVKCNIRSGIE